MREIEYYPPNRTGLDPEVAHMLEQLDIFVAKNALVKRVQNIPSEQVMIEYEQNRVVARHQQLAQRRNHESIESLVTPTVTGPDCEKIYPLLLQDEWEYREGSFLASLELREMLASTIIPVLSYAEEYTTIIGEDRSGRLPALITAPAVNTIRERQGLSKARQVFISGRIGANQVPLFRAENPDDHALVVTEYIKSGASARRVLDALRRVGFEHISIEAVGADKSISAYGLDVELSFVGDIDSYTAIAYEHLYDRPKEYTGITKKNNGSPHARAVELSAMERKILHETRRDIAHFANEVVKMHDILDAQ